MIKHHWKVLILLRLQADFCLDGIQLYSSLLSNRIYPVLNFVFYLTDRDGQQDEQVALNGTKENENTKCTQNKGGHSDARATV